MEYLTVFVDVRDNNVSHVLDGVRRPIGYIGEGPILIVAVLGIEVETYACKQKLKKLTADTLKAYSAKFN